MVQSDGFDNGKEPTPQAAPWLWWATCGRVALRCDEYCGLPPATMQYKINRTYSNSSTGTAYAVRDVNQRRKSYYPWVYSKINFKKGSVLPFAFFRKRAPAKLSLPRAILVGHRYVPRT